MPQSGMGLWPMSDTGLPPALVNGPANGHARCILLAIVARRESWV
jgi:hypothetical protein